MINPIMFDEDRFMVFFVSESTDSVILNIVQDIACVSHKQRNTLRYFRNINKKHLYYKVTFFK